MIVRRGIIGVERSFTGQQKDFGTGLIYFKARYYDPELGTFISPDTLVPDAGNLFDYNRYMFVRGNPLKYVDANGHEPIHHRNYPCSYTACVRDGSSMVSVSQWTPELHQRYYGAGSHLEQELPTLEEVHLALDVVGTVDPTGVADGVNGVIYLGEGNYVDAGLSALAILPLGDLAKGGRYADEATDVLISNNVLDKVRTGSATKLDPYHAFPDIVDNYVNDSTHFLIPTRGAGGAVNRYSDLYQLEGSFKNNDGIFEWIVDNNEVTHRRFIPNGTITGKPNQIVKK